MKRYSLGKIEWLLFFYSVPSKPVNNRMKIWRTLMKAGAAPFKGSTYILPYSDDHYELLQWLVASVTGMGGEAAFVKTATIETIKDVDIISLFDQQLGKDYQELSVRLEELENRVKKIDSGATEKSIKKLEEEFRKVTKEFNDLGKIDFFVSSNRMEVEKRLTAVSALIVSKSAVEVATTSVEIEKRQLADYQGRTWVTRKRPFIDRIASAWLIKRFIDSTASFDFIDENELGNLPVDRITYDMVGAEFTHVGDKCTFEVLLETFSLHTKSLGIIAEIIHQLDLQDEKYHNPSAEGLLAILSGTRKTVNDDHDLLAKGMGIIDMLHAAQG